MKKNTYHLGNNVLLTFKSVEVYLIDDERILTPLYIPIHKIPPLMKMSKKQIELSIMQSVAYDKE